MIAPEFKQTEEGKRLGVYIETLNEIARTLLNFHKEETCCSEYSRHFEFQCPSNKDELLLQLIIQEIMLT